jgi:hypothetical protein
VRCTAASLIDIHHGSLPVFGYQEFELLLKGTVKNATKAFQAMAFIKFAEFENSTLRMLRAST